jgi:hypothetical protein
MDDIDFTAAEKRSARRWGTGAALAAAGLAGGLILAGTVSANAATTTPTPSATSSSADTGTPQAPPNAGDPTKPQRSDESLLTGTTLEKVVAAAEATYPDATVQRAETDSDGVYEVHLLTSDGTPVTVEVDASFTVTGEEAMGAGGLGGANGVDPDPSDNDGPGTGIPGGTAPSSTTSSSSSA